MGDPQFLSDLLCGGVLAFERERRSPRCHAQAGDFLQNRQQLLANSIGEIFAPFVVAEIVESQDRDRLGINWRRLSFSQRLGCDRLFWLCFRPDKLEDKQARGNNSQHHGEAYELPSSLSRDGLAGCYLRLPLNPFRRDLKSPRKDKGRREAQNKE